MLDALDKGDSEFVNKTLNELMKSDPNIKFNLKHGMWTTGSNSPYELITGAKKYSVKDTLKNITCPTLVLEGEKDDSFPGQPKKVCDGLVSVPPSFKKYILFTVEKGGEEHFKPVRLDLSTKEYLIGWMKPFECIQKSKFVVMFMKT